MLLRQMFDHMAWDQESLSGPGGPTGEEEVTWGRTDQQAYLVLRTSPARARLQIYATREAFSLFDDATRPPYVELDGDVAIGDVQLTTYAHTQIPEPVIHAMSAMLSMYSQVLIAANPSSGLQSG